MSVARIVSHYLTCMLTCQTINIGNLIFFIIVMNFIKDLKRK